MDFNKIILAPIVVLIIGIFVGGVFYWWGVEGVDYPEDYILQEEELPLDFKYAHNFKEVELGPGFSLENNPGSPKFELNQPRSIKPDKEYCAIYSGVEESFSVIVHPLWFNTEEDFKKTKEKIDTIGGIKNKNIFLENGKNVLTMVEIRSNDLFYKEDRHWVDVLNRFVKKLEKKSDLNKISTRPAERKEKAKKHMNEAMNHLEKVKKMWE